MKASDLNRWLRVMRSRNDLLVLAGAVTGGTLGYFAFFWIARQGFYGLILPGGLLGLGAGISRPTLKSVPVVCGVLALGLGVLTEWRFAPFVADSSFEYFLRHIHQLRPLTLIMITVGALIGFWVPFRRIRPTKNIEPGT